MIILNKLYSYKKQIQSIGIYVFASLIPMLLSIISNPFFAKNLSPKDYAIMGYFQALNPILLPFISFYLIHYFQKRYFEVSKEERILLKRFIFNVLVKISFIFFVISFIILFIYFYFFMKKSSISFFPYAILCLFPIYLTGIYNLELVDCKMKNDSKRFFRISVFTSVFTLIISFILVVFFKYGASGRLIGTISGPFLLYIILLRKYREYLSFKLDKKELKIVFIFCLPLVLSAMLEFFSKGFDRFFLEKYVNINELGYYSVGLSMAAYISVFTASLDNTFSPEIYKSIASKNIKRYLSYIFVELFLISIIVAVFIVLCPYIIDILTAGRYVASAKYARIIALSSLTSTACYMLNRTTIALGYTKLVLYNKIIGSGFCVFMFYIFINKWGSIGASWGVVLSFLIFLFGNIIFLFFYKRNYYIKHIKNMFK